MGKIRTLLSFLTLGIIESDKMIEARKENERRKNTKIDYDDILSFEDFKRIAIETAKPIKRLHVEVFDGWLKGTVTTTSGINRWKFCVDFNDYGKITGRVWWDYCENNDSSIPNRYVNELCVRLKEYINENKIIEEKKKAYYGRVCDNCGALLKKQQGFSPDINCYICKSCGTTLYHPGIYSGELYPGTYWHCTNCNSLLNIQINFKDNCNVWKCKECGKDNKIRGNNKA